MTVAEPTIEERWQVEMTRARRASAAVEARAIDMIQSWQLPPEVTVGETYYHPKERAYFAVVVHRESKDAVWVSTDGDPAKAVRLPRKFISLPEVVRGFAAIGVPGWLANGRTGEYARPPIVQAKLPQLFGPIQWSERQREAWAWACQSRNRMAENARIDHQKRHGTYYIRPKIMGSPW